MYVALANDPGLGCGADKSNFTQLWQCSQRNGQQRSSAPHASRRHHQGASLQPRPDRERRECPHSSWTEASCSERTSPAGERRLFRECPSWGTRSISAVVCAGPVCLFTPRDICIAFVLAGGWHASVARAAHKFLEECGYMGWIDIHRWYINSAVVIAQALECARVQVRRPGTQRLCLKTIAGALGFMRDRNEAVAPTMHARSPLWKMVDERGFRTPGLLIVRSAFLGTNPTNDITSSKWSKKYRSITVDGRPEWQDTRSLSETECQFGRLSFFKSAAYRGSWCKFFSRGSTFVSIRPLLRWA